MNKLCFTKLTRDSVFSFNDTNAPLFPSRFCRALSQ